MPDLALERSRWRIIQASQEWSDQILKTFQKENAMNTTQLENPFSSEPVELPKQFFGRKSETQRTLDFLRRQQCVSVVGPASIGKTSFLRHIAHPCVRTKHRRAEEKIFVHLDGRSLADLKIGECCLHICREVVRQIKETASIEKSVGDQLDGVIRKTGNGTAYFHLDFLFRTIQSNGLALIVLLDNFDPLAQSSHLEDHFFAALRSLNAIRSVTYLVASQYPMHELEQIRPGSPFFNIFQAIKLGAFEPDESRDLVVTLLQRADVVFPNFILDHILQLGKNEPHHLQRAGGVAFQLWQENGGDWQMRHCEEISRRFKEAGT